jgi:integrase
MRVPRYRKKPGRDFAFIENNGERIRLPGKYNSTESREAYRKFLTEILGNQILPKLVEPGDALTINVLVGVYLDFARSHYQNSGPRGEYANLKYALDHLVAHYGAHAADSLGPLKLKGMQAKMLAAGSSASYINKCMAKIRRCYKWGASEEIVPITTFQALLTLPSLRTDKAKKKPVALADYQEVLDDVGPIIADMMRVQWYTGVRSGSICRAVPAQFDRSAEVWIWRPRHKNEHRGMELIVPIGPRCQAVLLSYLERGPEVCLFSPRETRSCVTYGTEYKPGSYRTAVVRAIERINGARTAAAEKAGVDPILMRPWSPHGLRHSKGHAVRSAFGAEAAQAILGHESLEATAIYSDKRLALAIEVARETG